MINKKVVAGLMIFGVVLISVGIVSAGFLDFIFGDDDEGLEGELAESADVSVTITGTYPAPEIVWISDLNNKEGTTIIPADRNLNTGATITKQFTFYVYSAAGTGALPATPAAADVFVIVENTGAHDNGAQRQSTGACTSAVINSYDVSTDDCDAAGTFCSGPDLVDGNTIIDVRSYECTVTFQHYEDPTVDVWSIRAYVQDLQSPTPNEEGYDGTTDHVNSIATPVRTTEFNEQTELQITDDVLSFGTVDFGSNLNQEAEGGSHPSIENIANAQINQVQITAYDIPDDPDVGDYWVRSEWFYTDPDSGAESCDSVNAAPGSLIDSTQIDTGISAINYGVDGDARPDEILYLCLDEVIAGPNTVSGTYATTGAGGTIWDLQAS